MPPSVTSWVPEQVWDNLEKVKEDYVPKIVREKVGEVDVYGKYETAKTNLVNKVGQVKDDYSPVVYDKYLEYRRHYFPAIDDFWDIVERVKANFSEGVFKGLEKTLQDLLFWVTTWQIWQTKTIQDWFKYLLDFAENAIKAVENWWNGFFHHQYLPSFIQSRLELLKVDIKLRKMAEFINDQNSKLAKVPVEGSKSEEEESDEGTDEVDSEDDSESYSSK